MTREMKDISTKTIIKQTRVQFPLSFSINPSKQKQTENMIDVPEISQKHGDKNDNAFI